MRKLPLSPLHLEQFLPELLAKEPGCSRALSWGLSRISSVLGRVTPTLSSNLHQPEVPPAHSPALGSHWDLHPSGNQTGAQQ